MENIERQLTILKGIDWVQVKENGLTYAIYLSAADNEIEDSNIEYLTRENSDLFGANVYESHQDNYGLLRCFCLVQAIINALESNKRKRSEPGRDESAQRN